MSMILCAAFLQAALLAAEPTAAAKAETAKPAATAKADASKTEKEDAAKKEALDVEKNESYTEAHRMTAKTGKPLVVMVGADWCAPCQMMRRTILPRVREHGLFRKVAFAHVNVDREKNLAAEITGGGKSVPQLVMFHKTKNGWVRQKMVGSHTVEEVEKFINDGLAMDAEEHKDDAQTKPEKTVSKESTSAEQPGDDKRRG
jgi:thioredoxin-like negative regulator of GroEL